MADLFCARECPVSLRFCLLSIMTETLVISTLELTSDSKRGWSGAVNLFNARLRFNVSLKLGTRLACH